MPHLSQTSGPIGIFDSGYGGLTILKDIRRLLPQYDYLYLGDNARAPYGSHSYDVIYTYTLQAVRALFARGCHLVILACNTASAKALRTIQQRDLPQIDATRRVLGIIRPTAESVGLLTKSRHIGILGTVGTVQSGSYDMEIGKLWADIAVTGQACPMWVPLVENMENEGEGADYFVKKYIDLIMAKDEQIDTLILGCTHYPLLVNKIKSFCPPHIQLMQQGEYVAQSLKDYLQRHTDMADKCTKRGKTTYLTTESAEKFAESAHFFLGHDIDVEHIELSE